MFSKNLQEVNIMKKFKLLVVVALALVAAMALSSCALFGKQDLDKIFNPEYDDTTAPYARATEISDLADYKPYNEGGYGHFAVFYKENTNDTDIAVYSFIKGAVVLELTADDEMDYDVDMISGAPVFVVYAEPLDEDDAEVTKTYYDAQGNVIVSVTEKNEVRGFKYLTSELCVINTGLYAVDEETGSVTKQMDIPVYVSTDLESDGDYFYSFNRGNGGFVVIYDDAFAPIATWTAPAYATGVNFNIMNNGDVLAQYVVEAPENATFYDFYAEGHKSVSLEPGNNDSEEGSLNVLGYAGYLEAGVKYNLESKLITVKGKVKDVNLNYIVADVVNNADGYDEEADTEDNFFADKFDNIATIFRIEDKRLDMNEYNADLVLMKNSGKVQKSIKFLDGQSGYGESIEKLSNDRFLVETVYGYAIVDNKGEVQIQMTADVRTWGDYFYDANAIYDYEFKVVYDLNANDATIESNVGDTLFVKSNTSDPDGEYVWGMIRDGKYTELFECDKDELDYFTTTSFGYCIAEVSKSGDTTYTYYSESGVELLETESPVIRVATGDEKMIVTFEEDDERVYYVIEK